MQDRFTGDIGDFGKYGLLKALCQEGPDRERLSLGIVWYLVPNESHNADGKHVSYLRETTSNSIRFRKADPFLYDSLADIVNNDKRKVSIIREENILPIGTVYFEKYLSYVDIPYVGPESKIKRLVYRSKWFKEALDTTIGCNIVFVDPDNGLEVKSVERHHSKGPKYTYYEELVPFLKRGQSLVIYHHLCRQGTAKEQIDIRLKQITSELGVTNEIYPLLYHRGTLRVFFIIPAREHKDLVKKRVNTMKNDPIWSEHFCLFGE